MNRNQFFRKVLLSVCSAGAILASAGNALAQEVIELKVSHYLPPQHTINKELLRWAGELNEKSRGQLKVSVFPAGQMGPVQRQYDLARTGVSDMSFFLHGSLPGRFALTELAQLPYVFMSDAGRNLSSADASALLTSLSGRLESEYQGTKILYLIAQPTIGLYFNKQVVRSPADMKGQRIRHNGPVPARMLEAWGATPASLPPAELADALEKRTLNGMLFNAEAAQAFQLASGIRSVTDLNAYAVTFALVINAKRYESLPAPLKKLIDDSTGVEAARRVGALYDDAEVAGRKYLQDNKVTFVTPTSAEVQAFRAPLAPIVKDVIDQTQSKGLPAQAFYSEIRARVNKAGK